MRHLRENVVYFTINATLFLSRGPISHLTGPKAKITQKNIAKQIAVALFFDTLKDMRYVIYRGCTSQRWSTPSFLFYVVLV